MASECVIVQNQVLGTQIGGKCVSNYIVRSQCPDSECASKYISSVEIHI